VVEKPFCYLGRFGGPWKVREPLWWATKCTNYWDCFFSFFFFFFLNHMFLVSMVQEMTCIFNDMAKTKPKIKLTINKRNNHNHFPQCDQ